MTDLRSTKAVLELDLAHSPEQGRRRRRPTIEPRLNVITLAVDDLERALAFYRDGLGLHTKGVVADLVDEKTGAAGAIVIFKLDGGLTLTLYPRSELAKDAAVPARPQRIRLSLTEP